MRKVQVRLFARARDLAGAPALSVDLADEANVAALRVKLAEQCPALAGLLPRSALAINDEFAEDQASIPMDAEVALLPPVSGG